MKKMEAKSAQQGSENRATQFRTKSEPRSQRDMVYEFEYVHLPLVLYNRTSQTTLDQWSIFEKGVLFAPIRWCSMPMEGATLHAHGGCHPCVPPVTAPAPASPRAPASCENTHARRTSQRTRMCTMVSPTIRFVHPHCVHTLVGKCLAMFVSFCKNMDVFYVNANCSDSLHRLAPCHCGAQRCDLNSACRKIGLILHVCYSVPAPVEGGALGVREVAPSTTVPQDCTRKAHLVIFNEYFEETWGFGFPKRVAHIPALPPYFLFPPSFCGT